MIKLFLLAFCFLSFSQSFAQSSEKKYAVVDATVSALGAMAELNVAQIAEAITKPFSDKEQKARAIYYWIANNIAIDAKKTKAQDTRNSEPEKTIAFRSATPFGFSLLVQEMCSDANIRCLSVDGYVNFSAEEIEDGSGEKNFSWNVVQLDQSPDKWFYVDACKAAGSLDPKMSVFTKKFTSGYFFARRDLFNLDHYPENSAWQLGKGPKSLKEFYSLPVIHSAAYTLDLGKPSPDKGLIKVKQDKPFNFEFPYNGTDVSKITLLIVTGRKQQNINIENFSTSAGKISFNYTFKDEDEFPLTILADGRELISYMVEVKEK